MVFRTVTWKTRFDTDKKIMSRHVVIHTSCERIYVCICVRLNMISSLDCFNIHFVNTLEITCVFTCIGLKVYIASLREDLDTMSLITEISSS